MFYCLWPTEGPVWLQFGQWHQNIGEWDAFPAKDWDLILTRKRKEKGIVISVAEFGDTVKGREMCVLEFWFKGVNFNRRREKKRKLIREEKEQQVTAQKKHRLGVQKW